ncbi:MAG: hypothetical protein CMM50_18885 [Rhodospirillaceae bacterium]|nr:hypothetical protein [Rhodospirillaceae bacterium]
MEFKALQLFRENVTVDWGNGEPPMVLRSNRLVTERAQDMFVVRTKYLYDALRTMRVMAQCVRRRPGLWSEDCVACWSEEYHSTHLPTINEDEPHWMAVYKDGVRVHGTRDIEPFDAIERIAKAQPIEAKTVRTALFDDPAKLGNASVSVESVPYVIVAQQRTQIKVWYLLRAGNIENQSFSIHIDDQPVRRRSAAYSVVYVAEKLFELNALVEEAKIVRKKFAEGAIDYIRQRNVHEIASDDLKAKHDSLLRYARNVQIDFVPREPGFDIPS